MKKGVLHRDRGRGHRCGNLRGHRLYLHRVVCLHLCVLHLCVLHRRALHDRNRDHACRRDLVAHDVCRLCKHFNLIGNWEDKRL